MQVMAWLKLSYSPELRAILAAGHRQIRNREVIPYDEFWKQVAQRAAKRNRRSK